MNAIYFKQFIDKHFAYFALFKNTYIFIYFTPTPGVTIKLEEYMLNKFLRRAYNSDFIFEFSIILLNFRNMKFNLSPRQTIYKL